jgi:uncharacterized protein (DUF2461 family)
VAFRPRRKRWKKAPSNVLYTSEDNEKGVNQPCVYVQCQLSEHSVGPIWGHSDASVKRALATLTTECECPARFHVVRDSEGARIDT